MTDMTEPVLIPKEYLDRASVLPALPKAPSEEELNRAGKPIVVTLDAQEIGALYVARCTPYDFVQNLLAKFQRAGVPVEGVLKLKLAHGKVFKLKDDVLRKPGVFTYLWLPQPYVDVMGDQTGAVA